jgi:hypothetical protein
MIEVRANTVLIIAMLLSWELESHLTTSIMTYAMFDRYDAFLQIVQCVKKTRVIVRAMIKNHSFMIF